MSSELDGQPRLYYPRCRAFLDVVLDGYDEGDGLGSPNQPMHCEIYPRSAKVHGNAYHQPDSWELTFDARNCPFDPAILRAATVQIYFYDAGQMDDPSGAVDADQLEQVEPDIIGLFDDDSMELSNDGRWISVQGQDMTTLFSGKQWPPMPGGRARRLPTGMKLDQFVKDRIREADPTGRMHVAFGPGIGESSMPKVGKEQPAGHGRGIPVKQQTTYWDVIYGTVIRCGFICYVRGWNVVIAKPKNLGDYRNDDIVQMAWGNNVEHLTLQRKLGKTKVPTVIVVAYDENGQFVTRQQYPDANLSSHAPHGLPGKVQDKVRSVEKHTIKSTTAASAAPKRTIPKAGGKPTVVKKDEEFMIVPIHGTWDPDALLRAAQSLYTLIGRGERRIIVKTHDLTDIYGKLLLHLSPGDAIQVNWEDFNHETMRAMSVEQRFQFLTKVRGYQTTVAQTLALAYDKLKNRQNPPLRIREITKDYDVTNGMTLEIDAVDFATPDGETNKVRKLGDIGATGFDVSELVDSEGDVGTFVKGFLP